MAASAEDKSLMGVIAEFLSAPGEKAALPFATDDLVEALRASYEESEDLRRYRETRERMGRAPQFSFEPPNFPYTVHTA